MTTNELKAALILLGISTTQLANVLGVTVQAVSPVITGARNTPRIRAAIAEAIGKPVAEIWPDAKPAQEQAA